MQDRWDTKPEGCMTGRMQERKDEGMKGRWDEKKEGIPDWKDLGLEGYMKEGGV